MLQMMFHEATACHVTAEVRFFYNFQIYHLSKFREKKVLRLDKGPN